MAKVTVAGNAVVITSALKFEELETIKKYRPKALKLMGGEDGKEEIFAINVTSGRGAINEYGVEFDSVTHDDEAKATVTKVFDDIDGDVKEFVAEEIGANVLLLNELEATLPAVLEEIATKKAAMLDAITVAQ